MFAVVKIAGQQFRVQAGQSLYVPHLQGKSGDKVEFSEVLLTDDNGSLSTGADVKATVTAEILRDLVQGDKVIAFKMKRRKGYRNLVVYIIGKWFCQQRFYIHAPQPDCTGRQQKYRKRTSFSLFLPPPPSAELKKWGKALNFLIFFTF